MAVGPYGNFSSKVFERLILDVLQPDAYLQSLVDGRIYPQHLAMLTNPTYPNVTLMRSGLGGDPSITNLDNMFLIIDVWSKKNVAELWSIYADINSVTNAPVGIRALLHNQGFDFTEAIIGLCTELWVTDNLYEPRTQTFHLSARYSLKVAAKNITSS
jgi:hypothetical protein